MTQVMQAIINRLKKLPEALQHKTAPEIERLLDQIENRSPKQRGKRIAGLSQGIGEFYMSEDFDEPLPDSFWLGEE